MERVTNIILVSFIDKDRALPLGQIATSKIIFVHGIEDNETEREIRKLVSHYKNSIGDIAFEEVGIDTKDIGNSCRKLIDIVTAEKKNGSEVYINITSAGSLVSMAAQIAASRVGAKLYYVKTTNYSAIASLRSIKNMIDSKKSEKEKIAKIREAVEATADKKSDCIFFSRGCGQVTLIPTMRFSSPDQKKLRILGALCSNGERVNSIKELIGMIGKDETFNLYAAESLSNMVSKIVVDMEREGLLYGNSFGRNKKLAVTPMGNVYLKIFSK